MMQLTRAEIMAVDAGGVDAVIGVGDRRESSSCRRS